MFRLQDTALAGLTLLAALAAGCGTAADPGTPGMLLVPGGEFTMGADDGLPFEGRNTRWRWMPSFSTRHEVTNARYAEFADATGYVTESEKLGWSGVFDTRRGGWAKGDGADWRHPSGPGSSHRDMGDYPVVHVSWFDAAAYCEWRGARLPTEAEFEYAARGGVRDARYAWGDQLAPGGVHQANLWQGEFPVEDRGRDGYSGLAPVGTFPPNGLGFHDLTGNVWEWVQDWYAPDYFARSPRKNPRGPARGTEKVHRGGSWLCSENYCRGYRLGSADDDAPGLGPEQPGFPLRGRSARLSRYQGFAVPR